MGRIGIVDAGLGNHVSVANMLRRAGAEAVRCTTPGEATGLDGLILPGVGAFDKGVEGLQSSGWYEYLPTFAASRPVLGICLGMQLLGKGSEEGHLEGLGLLDLTCRRFSNPDLSVPHMGWNTVNAARKNNLIPPSLDDPRYYFAHSYRAVCQDDLVLGTCSYGTAFPAVVGKENIYGVQFHPEKSHRFGLALMQQFAGVVCA